MDPMTTQALDANDDPGGPDKSDAVLLYLMVGRNSFPTQDPDAVIAKYGQLRGREVTSFVEALIREIMTAKVDWASHSIESGAELAMSEMEAKHPDLSDDAIKALGWQFSFSWR